MATFAGLKTKVQNRLIDVTPKVTSEVGDLIIEAVEELQNRRNFSFMQEEIAYTTTAGTHVLGVVPDDFKEFREQPYYIENTMGRMRKFTFARSKQTALDAYPDQETNRPQYLARDEEDPVSGTSNFLVYPLGDGASDYPDGLYRVRVPYWKFLPTLSGDTDHNVITDDPKMAQFVIAWASKLGFELNWDEARSNFWESRAEKAWIKIAGKEGRKALAGINVLVPHMGADCPKVAE